MRPSAEPLQFACTCNCCCSVAGELGWVMLCACCGSNKCAVFPSLCVCECVRLIGTNAVASLSFQSFNLIYVSFFMGVVLLLMAGIVLLIA